MSDGKKSRKKEIAAEIGCDVDGAIDAAGPGFMGVGLGTVIRVHGKDAANPAAILGGTCGMLMLLQAARILSGNHPAGNGMPGASPDEGRMMARVLEGVAEFFIAPMVARIAGLQESAEAEVAGRSEDSLPTVPGPGGEA